MKRGIITTILFLTLIVPTLSAQSKSDKIKPQWLTMRNIHSKNLAYEFIVTEGMDTTLAGAKQSSFANLTTKIESERGIAITSTIDATSTMHRSQGVTRYDAKRVFNIQYKESDKLIKVTAKVIDEYWTCDGNTYRCHTLYSVANSLYSNVPITDDIQVTDSYGATALWRSAIIPGWGQFYKGSNLKGGLMLGGVAATVVGAIFVDNQARDYQSKMQHTYDVQQIRSYSTKASNCRSVRNVCIGAAAAIYVYNLVDAVVAPGSRRVVVKNKWANYNVNPAVMNDGSLGLAAGVNF